MAVTTLAELFLHAAGHRKPDALLHKAGGRFQPISTAELVDRVRRLARALEKRGVERGDRVALMAENGPHWPIVDFATLCRGAITTTVYPTLTATQAAYIVRDSGSKVVFVQDRERLDGLLELRSELPELELFVLIDGEPPASGSAVPGVVTMRDLEREGDDLDPERFGDRIHEIRPEDVATLIYTSGTTGEPKGVMLTHGNVVSNVMAALEAFPIEPHYTGLCFLPLAHSYERMVDFLYFHQGVTVAYAESVQTLSEDLGLSRPHCFVSVPRVYEKVLAKIQENVARGSGTKRKIFDWASRVGREALPWRLKRARPPGLLGLQLALADKLVFGKIKERLGGRFEFALSGGAPLGREIAEFFWGAGIEIYEGYGLTETSPVVSVNTPGAVKLGTVGKPIPRVEVEIAADGEILCRGPNVMKGYWRKPEATAEAIDAEGWFHTGDIGELDAEGFLSITDRKKEILINAYGKNIAPAPIENLLKASRFIGQVVVIGDRRKFLTALIVPDFEALAVWAEGRGIDPSDRAALVERPEVRELLAKEVQGANEKLAHYEEIVNWGLLPEEMTIEGGELTPTQKVKRRVVDEKYREVIDRVYAEVEARSNR
ncbi:MAG TPA: long-chain fatty acid--CoA ligase [Thermoanaerobaculia bacterium]|nr:long-chain fatty acid--CoA ligase [Thermoanaerobaculia bacterium]